MKNCELCEREAKEDICQQCKRKLDDVLAYTLKHGKEILEEMNKRAREWKK